MAESKMNTQVGSGLAGESHSASALCPTYSGGDKNRHDVRGPSVASAQEAAADAVVDVSCMLAPRSDDLGTGMQLTSSLEASFELFDGNCEVAAGSGLASVARPDSALSSTARNSRETINSAEVSDSDASVRSNASKTSRFWKSGKKRQQTHQSGAKRPRIDSDSDHGSSPGSPVLPTPAPSVVTNRKREFLAEAREEKQKLLEEEVLMAAEERANLGLIIADEIDDRTANVLNARVHDDLNIIVKVAIKSGNLKGTLVKALKDAAASIKVAVGALHKRSCSEETVMLSEANTRLQVEMAELRQEMVELRDQVARSQRGSDPPAPRQPSPTRMEVPETSPTQGGTLVEELTRSIMLQVGGLVSARMEAIEERLLPATRLRPPLAADRRNTASVAATAPQPKSGTEPSAGRHTSATPQVRKENSKQKKKVTPHPLPPAPMTVEEGWTKVVRRGAKKAGGSQPLVPTSSAPVKVTSAAPKRSKKAKVKKLRPPRSSAVVITLQPGAVEKGESYAKVLAEAKAKIDLSSCGITGLRFRKAATGARILEVPGVTSSDKADALAQKLRESLDGEIARVSRPTKCADLRIMGLDDSASTEEVRAAIAKQGGCSEELVRVGELQFNAQGNGSIWTSCPVSAARKLGEDGRLLVGWIAASPLVIVCFASQNR
ncbi:Gag-like protein [Operophtera brumata]|uniref:Gag-like protein n=1 Tax=Operophtera brumata TaxID=104452 RepID=A0A0L7L983_OPEBR|nr:Gag-like protein [Operophtera brumata]